MKDKIPGLPPLSHLAAEDDLIAVRLAEVKDADELFELLNLPEIVNPAGGPRSVDDVRSWIEQDLFVEGEQPRRARDLTWVIQIDGVIVGALCLTVFVKEMARRKVRAADVWDFGRRPEAAGHSIARRSWRLVEPMLVRHFRIQIVEAIAFKDSREAGALLVAAACELGQPVVERADRYEFERPARS